MRSYARFIGICVVLFASLTACCLPGGGAKVQSTNVTNTTTLGAELEDLKKAYAQGIITEKEYNSAKEKIITERTKEK
ncbi:MAG: SHOCT domain-containing protein [Deltaproteobacteria bacterium]